MVKNTAIVDILSLKYDYHNLKVLQPSEDELLAHLEFIKMINKKSGDNCLWDKRLDKEVIH